MEKDIAFDDDLTFEDRVEDLKQWISEGAFFVEVSPDGTAFRLRARKQ